MASKGSWRVLLATALMALVKIACGESAAAATTTQPTAAPHGPTATPHVKKWVTTQHFTGSQDTQTATFHLPDGARIVWTATPTDTNANAFSIELDNSDGTPIDLVANTANITAAQTSMYNVHGDADAYLKVTALFCSYDIAVQVYQ